MKVFSCKEIMNNLFNCLNKYEGKKGEMEPGIPIHERLLAYKSLNEMDAMAALQRCSLAVVLP
jgi:hypothetical protein